jgi:hypothetical protein
VNGHQPKLQIVRIDHDSFRQEDHVKMSEFPASSVLYIVRFGAPQEFGKLITKVSSINQAYAKHSVELRTAPYLIIITSFTCSFKETAAVYGAFLA